MPSVSSGMNEVCAPALLADSGPATPAMAPWPNSSGVLESALLDRVGGEGRKDGAAARQDAERRADDGAAQDRRDHPLEIVARRQQAADLGHQHRAGLLALEIAQDFGDAEDADGDGDEVQPVGIFADAEREARRAGIDVGADKAEQQAERHHGQRLDDRAVGKRDRRDEADDHQREIFGRAELQRDAGQRRGEDRHEEGRDRAGEERAERGDRKRRAGPALAGHLVAVDRGDGGRGFARHVDQDRRGRAAILGAVIDAGEHDQRGDRLAAGR